MTSNKNRLGFILDTSEIIDNILIPKYYDPEILDELRHLKKTHALVSISELLDNGSLEVDSGDEIGKMAYGTGTIPFVRTSDISNWELATDPKQGVSKKVYDEYAGKQDIRPNDVLFVRDGTYLIGEACLVTQRDLPFLYQSHILKFRVKKRLEAGIVLSKDILKKIDNIMVIPIPVFFLIV